MKIKKEVVVRSVAGEHMLVPTGEAVLDFNGLFVLSESGKLLWDLIASGAEQEELVSALINEYGIDRQTAQDDTDEFIQKLCDIGIIE